MIDYTKRNRAAAAVHGDARTVSYDQGQRAYMQSVYNYMAGGLGLTGLVAFMVASSPALVATLFGNQITALLVMLAPLIFVFVFAAKINTVSMSTAQTMFWAYAGLMGLSLSTIFLAYTGASVARVFFITASVFGAMSLYGYTTKRDLTGMGSFLIMALFGMILASVVNIFMKSSGLDFALSVLGVLVFTGLTAYDTQRIKETYYMVQGSDVAGKAAIMGALNLYMDFINLMIMLLRFVGDRR